MAILQLHEILTSDTPSLLVVKLNYNFDQIFLNNPELQVVRGRAGVKGEQGISGLNGATWFNGTGNPNSSTSFFRPLIPGDYYINNSNGQVWYYNPASVIPEWIDMGFSLKSEINTPIVNESGNSIFVLSPINNNTSNITTNGILINPTSPLNLFITKNPTRLTSDLSNYSLVVSKDLTSSTQNMVFVIDGINNTNITWGTIDTQRLFIGTLEKTQMIINSELLKISSTDKITLSPGSFSGGFVEIESGRLQLPTSLVDRESDLTITTSALRIRGREISNIKRIRLEDMVTVTGDMILSGQTLVFPTMPGSSEQEIRKISNGIISNSSDLRVSLGLGATTLENANSDKLVIGRFTSLLPTSFVAGAHITSTGNAVFNDLTLEGPLVSKITKIIGGVIAGDGLTGGGEGLNASTGNIVTVSHATSSNQDPIIYENSPELIGSPPIPNPNGGIVTRTINLDTFGHVIGSTSKNLDDRYYTKSEINLRAFTRAEMIAIYRSEAPPMGTMGNIGLLTDTPGPRPTSAFITAISIPRLSIRPGQDSISYSPPYNIGIANVTMPVVAGVATYKLVVNYFLTYRTGGDLTLAHAISVLTTYRTRGFEIAGGGGGVLGEESTFSLSGTKTFILTPGQNVTVNLHLWYTNEQFQIFNDTTNFNNLNFGLSSLRTSYTISPASLIPG